MNPSGAIVRGVWILTYAIIKPAIRLFYNVQVKLDSTVEQVAHKPLIIVSNHQSIFDPWLVLLALPYNIYRRLLPIRIVGAIEFSNPISKALYIIGITKFIYAIYGVLPISRKQTPDEKIQAFATEVNKNQTLFLFPEGKLGPNDTLRPFKKGAVAVNRLTGAPILCAAIKSDGKFRGNCKVSYGETVSFCKRPDCSEEFVSESAELQESVFKTFAQI